MEVKELLTKTREWLTPETWTKGTYWRDADDNPACFRRQTTKTCLVGAMAYVMGSAYIEDGRNALSEHQGGVYASMLLMDAIEHYMWEEKERQTPNWGIVEFNDDDSTTLEDVHRVIDLALDAYKELEEGEED